LIGDDLIENEYIRIHEQNMILMVLIDIDYIKIHEQNLLLLEKQEITNMEMKHIIFGKMGIKKI
jgi:hypothetical protein